MTAPETTLDRRFSDPEAEATGWAETKQALDAAQLFWIATVRSDGRPHVTPLVAVWVDEALYFTFVTGLTIGYGDFTPKHLSARLLALVIGFAGIVLTGVVAAVTVQALNAAGRDRAE